MNGWTAGRTERNCWCYKRNKLQYSLHTLKKKLLCFSRELQLMLLLQQTTKNGHHARRGKTISLLYCTRLLLVFSFLRSRFQCPSLSHPLVRTFTVTCPVDHPLHRIDWIFACLFHSPFQSGPIHLLMEHMCCAVGLFLFFLFCCLVADAVRKVFLYPKDSWIDEASVQILFFFDMGTVRVSCAGFSVGVVNLNGIASEGNRSYSSSLVHTQIRVARRDRMG
jgi:hypothetical protein